MTIRNLFAVLATTSALMGGASVWADDLRGLPSTDWFEPLLADPKEPRFFMSALQVDSGVRDSTIGAVGFGEDFGILRREFADDVGGQWGIAGAVFAQFDLEAPSSDLINADYVIGLPITWRARKWSGRVRLYHQSSHLGDEYLLSDQPRERVNLSYEAVEALLAYDLGSMRVYGGGEYLVHRDPADLGKRVTHTGLEWRSGETAFRVGNVGRARWVAGVDLKFWEENDWDAQLSAKAGIELAPLDRVTNGRHWSLLLEYYDGPSHYGQFYELDLQYAGIAIQLGL